MKSESSPRILPWVSAVITMTLWASSFVVIRNAADHFTPVPMTVLRCGSAAILLTVWMLFRRPRFPRTNRSWVALVPWGIAWFAIYTVTLNAAERTVDAGTAAMIVNLAPLIVAVAATFLLGETLSARLIIGILVALAGIGLITGATFTGHITGTGLALSLVSALLYAGCILVQKKFLSSEDSVTVTWLGITVGALVCAPFTPGLLEELAQAPFDVSLQVIYLGVASTAIAFNLWGYSLRHLPAGLLSASSLVVPALVVVMAWVLLGEVPPLLAGIGGVLCLAGAGLAIVPQIVTSLRAYREPAVSAQRAAARV